MRILKKKISAREANVYRLAEVSNAIIDQCVAQGVPFAREYGGLLDNRSFLTALCVYRTAKQVRLSALRYSAVKTAMICRRE